MARKRKLQASKQADGSQNTLTRLSACRSVGGGKSPTTTELTNHLPSPPLLFSFRHRCRRRRCCCRFRGSFFSSLPSPFAFPPSLGGLRTLFYPPANAHWSQRAFPPRSSNGASRPAAPFEAKTAESAIAARAPSFALPPLPFRPDGGWAGKKRVWQASTRGNE